MTEQDRWRRHEELHREVLAKDLEQNRVSANKVLSILFEYLAPGSILDVGCGPGSISVGLAAAVAPGKFFGIDMEQSQLDRATVAAREAGLSQRCRG